MPSPPTRRTRSTNEDRSLPIVPILIGVIVLGFVIGAGLSLSGRHDAAVVAVASPSPAGADTFVPVTPAPTEKPTPQATAEPALTARAKIARTPQPTTPEPATAKPATAAPAIAARAKAAPAVVTTPRRVAAAQTVTPSREDVANALAAPPAPRLPRATNVPKEAADTGEAAPATVKPVTAISAPALATAAPVAAELPDDSAFARLSAAVVRQYLESVKRSDQAGAFAVLSSPPASETDLAEYGVVDGRTRIARVDARGAANDDVFVSVQMDTPSGPYFGQYTVHKSDTGAAVIVAHSIVKS